MMGWKPCKRTFGLTEAAGAAAEAALALCWSLAVGEEAVYGVMTDAAMGWALPEEAHRKAQAEAWYLKPTQTARNR